ncbi:MAG: zf-HC2 domain-containing protein [Candidatus Eremiobacteraeota bacterium]|nr:zf-HC2 domain-containing protein [Candidatus Eremiobacteraeota bacterium]
MPCNDLKEKLSAFLDGELTAGERQTVEEHLATCKACREHANELMEVITVVKGMPAPSPRADFTGSALARIAREEKRVPLIRRLLAPVEQAGILLFRSPAFYGLALLCVVGRFCLSPPTDTHGEFAQLNNPAFVQALAKKGDAVKIVVSRGEEIPEINSIENKKEGPYDVHKKDISHRVAVRRHGGPRGPGLPRHILRHSDS